MWSQFRAAVARRPVWRRLQVRWDRDAERWFAFVVVCAVVCFNRL